MLDIAEELHRWVGQGRAFAVATVVSVTGSAPRRPGAALAVDGAGAVIGSVSGGCVEGAVYELCRQALVDGRTVRERFGEVGGEGEGDGEGDAFAVGLMCGGEIEVLVTPVLGAGISTAVAEGAGISTAATRGVVTAGAATEGRATAGAAGQVGEGPVAEGRAPAGQVTEGVVSKDQVKEGASGQAREGVTGAAAVSVSAIAAAARRETAALVRVVDGPAELLGRALLVRPGGGYEGTLGGGPALDRTAVAEAGALLDTGRTEAVGVGADGSRCGRPLTLFVESSVPPPRMIVFGAVDFAAALVRVGKFLGHHVTVCDARPVFATRARFPDADEIAVDWPHRYLAATATDSRTVLCVLTHDSKFDLPLLRTALRLPVAYIGAMGSRRTHDDRVRRLREAGVTERELARLRSPIGLDLGARTPEETALSIAAEIVADRRGGSGVSLAGAHTPIHHDGPRPAPGRIGSVA